MEDKILLSWTAPVWWIPSVTIVKSGIKRRWAIFFFLFTDVVDLWPRYTFMWQLQLRAWWFPVFFYRGWVKWEGDQG